MMIRRSRRPSIVALVAAILVAIGASMCWYAEPSLPSTPSIHFEDVAAKAGIRFAVRNSATPEKHLIETMIAGVAVLDYNNDGWPDLYFVNGASVPALSKDDESFWNRLYRNNRDGTFTDVTAQAGVPGVGYGMGVAVGDYDND